MWAGAVDSTSFSPWPRHLLEATYQEDKDQFNNSPFCADQYVSGGTGSTRWDPCTEMDFRASDGFVFGKPPIDDLRIRFIQDPTTVVANMLSSDVDAAFFAAIGYPQNLALEQAVWNGKVEYWACELRFLEFQQRDWGSLQRPVLDPRIRKAVLHTIDR